MGMDKYKDIIDLPHHVSPDRIPMSLHNRAAQFAPFAALTGYDESIREAARETIQRRELSEDEKAELDTKLNFLQDKIKDQPFVTVEYFISDEHKSGGRYDTYSGKLRRIDFVNEWFFFVDGVRLELYNIYDINIMTDPLEENRDV